MTTLYIIGNGFDLRHRLPTGYSDFYGHSKDALDELESYYNSGDSNQPWHNFENCLGTFDWRQFYDDHDNTDKNPETFKTSQTYGLEDDLREQSDRLVEKIRVQFHEWISDIDLSFAEAMFTFDHNPQFLTFNYTETLQDVYVIPCEKVLHIHGNAKACDDLIFGHGESMEEEPEQDANGDSNRTPFTDSENAAKYPFYALQKHVAEIIEKHRAYFLSLESIKKIVIIGHSLNDIDLPYFQEIAKNTPDCDWHVYCHSEKEIVNHPVQLKRCGVDTGRIKTCTYPER